MTGVAGELPLIDLHSHLVPGVDDGACSVGAAVEGVGRMVESGVRTIVTTPHLNASVTRDPGLRENILGAVDEAFEVARLAVSERYPELRFLRGHEVSLDAESPDLSDARIRLGDSSAVLVEWPWLQIPPETTPILHALQAQGVRPLVAHPERYKGYRPGVELPGEWRAAGAVLQVTFGSLFGCYGPQVRSVAAALLGRGWADCLATDFHARPHLRLFIREAREAFSRRGAGEAWELLTHANPGRICRGEKPLPVPPVEWNEGARRPSRPLTGR